MASKNVPPADLSVVIAEANVAETPLLKMFVFFHSFIQFDIIL
jgi:hypothetical protein